MRRPADYGFPMMEEFRPAQVQALEWAEEMAERGKRYLCLEAPTGVGKSLLAACWARRAYGPAKGLVLTHTLSLLRQYEGTLRVPRIEGRRHFYCNKAWSTCAEACRAGRSPCGYNCPYTRQWREASEFGVGVTTYSLWGVLPQLPEHYPLGVLVCDEAHLLLDAATDAQTLHLPCGYGVLDDVMWEAAEGRRPLSSALEKAARVLDEKSRGRHDELGAALHHLASWAGSAAARSRDGQACVITCVPHRWAELDSFCGPEHLPPYAWRVSPVWPDLLGFVHRHLPAADGRVMFMSATLSAFLPHGLFWDDRAVAEVRAGERTSPEDLVASLSLPSPFPAGRRPVFVWPAVRMSRHTDGVGYLALARAILRIMEHYRDAKGIVHLSSFSQVGRLCQALRQVAQGEGPPVIYHGPVPGGEPDRNRAISSFREAPAPCWLVSPSIHTGEDYPDDMARVNIVAKLPFPDRGDPLTDARCRDEARGKLFQAATTCSRLVQAYGRTTRSADDWSHTYILDANVCWLLAGHRDLFPTFFLEAVRWL